MQNQHKTHKKGMFLQSKNMMINMDKLYKVAAGHTARYPDGNEPYKIVSRILEECGEVASEVNHFERSGIKVQKHGEPSKKHLADEVIQALCALTQLVQYYGAEAELAQSIDESLKRIADEQSGKDKEPPYGNMDDAPSHS